MKKLKWTPSVEFLAQAGHLLLGAGFVLGVVLLAHRPADPFDAVWGGAFILVAYMLPKEFIFDLIVEEESVDTGWRDFGWMTIGVIIANLAVWLRFR